MAIPPDCLICELLSVKRFHTTQIHFLRSQTDEEVEQKKERPSKEDRSIDDELRLFESMMSYKVPSRDKDSAYVCDEHRDLEELSHLTLDEALEVYMSRLRRARLIRLSILILIPLSLIALLIYHLVQG